MTTQVLRAGGVVVTLPAGEAAAFEAARAAASVVPVPQSVPALYGLLAIEAAGKAAAYTAWAESPARTFAERAFISKALTWRRDSQVLQDGAAALGLDAAALDALFAAAAALAAQDAQG